MIAETLIILIPSGALFGVGDSVAKRTGTNLGKRAPTFPADLRAVRMFHSVSDEHLSGLFGQLKHHPMNAGAALHVHSELDGRVGFIWGGTHRLIGISELGVAITILTLKPGDCFGLVSAVLKLHTSDRVRLVSESAGLVLHIAGDDLIAASQHSEPLCKALITELATQAQHFGARTFELAALSVRKRIELELLRLSRDGLWSSGFCTLKNLPTHAVLASHVGATREVVTRHLRALAKEGVLKVQRGVITIIKPHYFDAIADAGVSQLSLSSDTDTRA